jgi:hypothetical protein
VKGGKTFRWAGEYSDDLGQRKSLSTELNVFETFSPELSPEQRKASTVFLANIDPELQLHVLDQVENPKLVVVDTMNYWITSKRARLLELMARVDIVILNDEEVKLLADDWSLPRAVRAARGRRQAVRHQEERARRGDVHQGGLVLHAGLRARAPARSDRGRRHLRRRVPRLPGRGRGEPSDAVPPRHGGRDGAGLDRGRGLLAAPSLGGRTRGDLGSRRRGPDDHALPAGTALGA